MYQALYRKWRPHTFDEVTGQEHITETLKTQVKTGRFSHAYLFTGTRGTGKTTCAKLLARAVNCEHPVDGNPCNTCATCKGVENGSILDVLELDAASNNGVDHVRALRDEAIYSPAYGKKRVYIVDEVHMLSGAAFNALLKILEEPPSHLMFILATTELYKVPATILSRCQRFSFRRLLPGEIANRLNFVAQAEHIPLAQDGAALLSRLADGSMRDALSLLDQCAAVGGTLDGQQVLNTMGLAGNLEVARLMDAVGRRDTAEALSIFSRLYEGGKELGAVLGELSLLARDMLIIKTVPAAGDALLTGGYETNTLTDLAAMFPPQRLIDCISFLSKTQNGFARSTSRRTDAELCIIRLCDEALTEDYTALAARVARLEEVLSNRSAALEKAGQIKNEAQPHIIVPGAATAEQNANTIRPSSRKSEADPANIPPVPGQIKTVHPGDPSGGQAGSGAPQLNPDKNCRNLITPSEVPDRKSLGAFWPKLVSSLKGKIDMPEYSILNNATMASGDYAEGVLTVTADSDFTKTMVGKPAVEKALAAEAEKMFGQPVRVVFTLASHKKRDKLDDLLALGQKFENIIIE